LDRFIPPAIAPVLDFFDEPEFGVWLGSEGISAGEVIGKEESALTVDIGTNVDSGLSDNMAQLDAILGCFRLLTSGGLCICGTPCSYGLRTLGKFFVVDRENSRYSSMPSEVLSCYLEYLGD
jgi:hypothetical protein